MGARSEAAKKAQQEEQQQAQPQQQPAQTSLQGQNNPALQTSYMSGSKSKTSGGGSTTTVGNTESANKAHSEHSNSGTSRSFAEMTPEAEAQVAKAGADFDKARGWEQNPDTGEWENKTLFGALRLNRDKIQAERERQERIARQKKLESGLYNSAALISDMISAGMGGNVWKRDKDTTAPDAAKEVNRLRELEGAEDAALAEKKYRATQEYLKERQQAQDNARNMFVNRVQQSESRGTQDSETSGTTNSRNESNSTNWSNTDTNSSTAYDPDKVTKKGKLSTRTVSGGSGGGSRQRTAMALKSNLKNEFFTIDMDKEDAESLANAVRHELDTLADSGDTAAIALKNKYYTGNIGSKKWDDTAMFNSGDLYMLPTTLNTILTQLQRTGFSEDGRPLSRTEIYIMLTGDENCTSVPQGVTGIDPTQIVR